MSDPIERAAEEIASRYSCLWGRPGAQRAIDEIANIIRDELFREVKPEDVRDDLIYLVKVSGKWYLSNQEIPTVAPWIHYGPIPMPK